MQKGTADPVFACHELRLSLISLHKDGNSLSYTYAYTCPAPLINNWYHTIPLTNYLCIIRRPKYHNDESSAQEEFAKMFVPKLKINHSRETKLELFG